MTPEAPQETSIETIGYARRSAWHPEMSYIGWTRTTVFDLELVYRLDLINLDKAHEERYQELEERYAGAVNDLFQAYEEIQKLERLVATFAVMTQRTEDVGI